MKSIYILSTKLLIYLMELPLIALLILAIAYNDHADGVFKFYPMQIVSILGMIFIFLYFLRFVKISTDEVRCKGIFSSKNHASLKKDRRLVLTLMKHKEIRIEVFGVGEAPLLDWVDPEEFKDSEINILRTTTCGSNKTAKKVLSYFDIDKNDFDKIFDSESFEKEYEFISLSVKKAELGKEISLKFNETL